MDSKLKGMIGTAGAGLGVVASRVIAVAQDDTAAAGNGGTSDAGASGGAVGVDDVNSGGSTGTGIGLGDIGDGAVAVDGGDSSSSTSLTIGADGGTAISDASGGDDNFAFVS